MKYRGTSDNFGLKVTILFNVCIRCNIPEAAYAKALPIILKGLALDFYYATLATANLPFQDLCRAIQEHFEDASYKRATLMEWNNLSLNLVKSQNPDKTTTQSFQLLVARL